MAGCDYVVMAGQKHCSNRRTTFLHNVDKCNVTCIAKVNAANLIILQMLICCFLQHAKPVFADDNISVKISKNRVHVYICQVTAIGMFELSPFHVMGISNEQRVQICISIFFSQRKV